MRKVAVVGMGGLFPHCKSIGEFRQKMFSNQSLIRKWPAAEQYEKNLRSKVAGFITYEEAGLEVMKSTILHEYPEYYKDVLNRIPPKNLATADVGSIWAMLGALDCIQEAQWTEAMVQSPATGIVVGSAAGGHEIARSAWENFFQAGKKTRALGTHNVDRTMVYRDAANISCLLKNKGVCEAIGSACATGLGNIGYAYRLIAFGLQDRIIAGGTECTSLETFLGFDAMQVLSSGFEPELSSRPFDTQRKGFVCSFGCGIVALEAYEQAKARGAHILAVIDNYFNNSDGDGDMFAPSFEGQQRLLSGLLNGYAAPDVVKVHGTSTPLGDPIELFSVVHYIGNRPYKISAPKSQFGHMLGAAGAVEFIASVMMLQEQQVLPCLNSFELNTVPEKIQTLPEWQGPEEPMAAYRHLLPLQATAMPIRSIASLNYGFGGTNSAVLISNDNK
jgi:3-oxoacyl-[acyl-carrier-protein] synthase I